MLMSCNSKRNGVLMQIIAMLSGAVVIQEEDNSTEEHTLNNRQ
jgi:hypothetical protein